MEKSLRVLANPDFDPFFDWSIWSKAYIVMLFTLIQRTKGEKVGSNVLWFERNVFVYQSHVNWLYPNLVELWVLF